MWERGGSFIVDAANLRISGAAKTHLAGMLEGTVLEALDLAGVEIPAEEQFVGLAGICDVATGRGGAETGAITGVATGAMWTGGHGG